MTAPRALSKEGIARIVALRRDLHKHPELSECESRTMSQIAAALEELGLQPRIGVAGTGVIVDLPGLHDGPLIALRADTDALPIQEETGLSFSSVHPGVMHACGHDGHTSMLVGAAALLLETPPPLPVRLLFQPAEESGTGAVGMIAAGALEGVAMIFGGHLDRQFPPGVLVVTDGPVNASTDTFVIVVHGRQGHGARPHEAVDAIVVASMIVVALQTVVSRQIDPSHAAVVTVGRLQAGTAGNVIAGTAELEGTIRAQRHDVRERLCQAVEQVASAVGTLNGATVSVSIRRGTPPVVNALLPTSLARAAAVAVVGDRVQCLDGANMGGEDFSFYLEHVPGCYIRYGSQVVGREAFPAHSSRFEMHEDALPVGAAWLAHVAHLAGAHLLGGA